MHSGLGGCRYHPLLAPKQGEIKMSGFAVVQSRALLALAAPAVTVEVHLANGLPSFTLVGLAETEVKEARERVRCAIQNSGLDFPNNKRITVNLAPADLPKDSGRFDLAIALGVLAASGQIDADKLAGYVFAGELSLAGDLRSVRGALAMSLALRKLDYPEGDQIGASHVQRTRSGSGRWRNCFWCNASVGCGAAVFVP
jgi:hypothetical protein